MASFNLPTREVLVFAYVVIVFPTAIEGSWKQQSSQRHSQPGII